MFSFVPPFHDSVSLLFCSSFPTVGWSGMEASEGDQGGWLGDWLGRVVRERWSGRVVGQDSGKLVRGLVLEVGRGEWSVMGSRAG